MERETRIVRVAAAQIAIGGEIEANVRAISEAMRQSADRGAMLVIFPETAITGYSPDLGRGRPPEDWPAVQAALGRIQELAGRLHLGVVVGSEAWEGSGWVNRLYAFSEEGALLGYYDKVHLTRADRLYYRPGQKYVVVTFRGIRLGLQICYDARFPEGYRALLDQGAEVVAQGFYGAGTGTWKVPILEAHLRSRAAENGCFVVAANVAGPLQIVVSQIVDPLGLMLARANQDWPEIIVADLALERIQESEVRADFLNTYRCGIEE
ncbi:MAG: carbon-nitrogen hydrolase family protein [Chloroflexi bacterium]|nr:carbon-nitrogen hydrolase family protein [Chloroflexota bacterium]